MVGDRFWCPQWRVSILDLTVNTRVLVDFATENLLQSNASTRRA